METMADVGFWHEDNASYHEVISCPNHVENMRIRGCDARYLTGNHGNRKVSQVLRESRDRKIPIIETNGEFACMILMDSRINGFRAPKHAYQFGLFSNSPFLVYH